MKNYFCLVFVSACTFFSLFFPSLLSVVASEKKSDCIVTKIVCCWVIVMLAVCFASRHVDLRQENLDCQCKSDILQLCCLLDDEKSARCKYFIFLTYTHKSVRSGPSEC